MTKTYFAVVHGDKNGTQTFAPMDHAPGASRLAFSYEADLGERTLEEDFRVRFFPLRLVDSEGVVVSTASSYEDARMRLTPFKASRIETRDGRLVLALGE